MIDDASNVMRATEEMVRDRTALSTVHLNRVRMHQLKYRKLMIDLLVLDGGSRDGLIRLKKRHKQCKRKRDA